MLIRKNIFCTLFVFGLLLFFNCGPSNNDTSKSKSKVENKGDGGGKGGAQKENDPNTGSATKDGDKTDQKVDQKKPNTEDPNLSSTIVPSENSEDSSVVNPENIDDNPENIDDNPENIDDNPENIDDNPENISNPKNDEPSKNTPQINPISDNEGGNNEDEEEENEEINNDEEPGSPPNISGNNQTNNTQNITSPQQKVKKTNTWGGMVLDKGKSFLNYFRTYGTKGLINSKKDAIAEFNKVYNIKHDIDKIINITNAIHNHRKEASKRIQNIKTKIINAPKKLNKLKSEKLIKINNDYNNINNSMIEKEKVFNKEYNEFRKDYNEYKKLAPKIEENQKFLDDSRIKIRKISRKSYEEAYDEGGKYENKLNKIESESIQMQKTLKSINSYYKKFAPIKLFYDDHISKKIKELKNKLIDISIKQSNAKIFSYVKNSWTSTPGYIKNNKTKIKYKYFIIKVNTDCFKSKSPDLNKTTITYNIKMSNKEVKAKIFAFYGNEPSKSSQYKKVGAKDGSSLSTLSNNKKINSQYIYIKYNPAKISTNSTIKFTLKVKYMNSNKKEEFSTGFDLKSGKNSFKDRLFN